MPSTSKKQHNFMAAIAKNPAFAKKVGIKASVGEEFLNADKGKKFKQGGIMATKKMRKFGDGGFADAGMMGGMGRMPSGNASYADAAAKMKRFGVKPNSADYRLGMKTLTEETSKKELEDLLPRARKSYDEEAGMKKGGKVEKESKSETKKEMAMDKKQDVAMIKKAFKEHDAQEHKGGKGTKLKLKKGGSVKGCGLASKGLTKGKIV